METNVNCRCPQCHSTNVLVSKRGYSVWLGLLGSVVVFIAYVKWWIAKSGYLDQTDEFVKNAMINNVENELLFFTALGLLAGFIGKGRVEAKCLTCGHTFSDISSTNVEKSNSSATESVVHDKAIDDLKRVKELLDLKVISQEEFDKIKAELLPSLRIGFNQPESTARTLTASEEEEEKVSQPVTKLDRKTIVQNIFAVLFVVVVLASLIAVFLLSMTK